MIEAITNVPWDWIVQPFETNPYRSIAVLYGIGMGVQFIALFITQYLFDIDEYNPLDDIDGFAERFKMVSVYAPVIEESAFRILPAVIFTTPWVVFAMSVVWALLHGLRGIFILTVVPVYVKMAVSGMFIELFIVHSLHNTVMLLLYTYYED